jgi:hypothetical protein
MTQQGGEQKGERDVLDREDVNNMGTDGAPVAGQGRDGVDPENKWKTPYGGEKTDADPGSDADQQKNEGVDPSDRYKTPYGGEKI